VSPFETFDLEGAILRSAASLGLELTESQVGSLAAHARCVVASNELLHLTAIREPQHFVDRHIGESLAGAILLDRDARGTLVDLGSGNGYPGIPLALARPFLQPVLVESAPRKAEFLRRALQAAGLGAGSVLEANVQRGADLAAIGPIQVLVTRAMGGWERLLPKLSTVVEGRGLLLVWCGDAIEEVARRVAWQRWRRSGEVPLPGLERGRVVRFVPA
jgi:16S rRNA (guanine527-N7)-methyltransferase